MLKRVLVVDDDSGIAELLKINLESGGFEVHVAGDGIQAIRLLDTNRYDLIITDIFMPEADGLEFMRVLRKRRSGEKIIAISGGGADLGPEEFLTLARLLGATKTFEKPFDCKLLVTAAKELLS